MTELTKSSVWSTLSNSLFLRDFHYLFFKSIQCLQQCIIYWFSIRTLISSNILFTFSFQFISIFRISLFTSCSSPLSGLSTFWDLYFLLAESQGFSIDSVRNILIVSSIYSLFYIYSLLAFGESKVLQCCFICHCRLCAIYDSCQNNCHQILCMFVFWPLSFGLSSAY